MMLHHAAEILVTVVVFVVKAVGCFLGQVLSDLVGAALGGIVRALFRRRRPPVFVGLEKLERAADERRRALWAEVLAEARARPPERPDPDPHVLKLSRIPTP